MLMQAYEKLGVPASASSDEVSVAYFFLARDIHPSMYPNNLVINQRFAELTGAYKQICRIRGFPFLLESVPDPSKMSLEDFLFAFGEKEQVFCSTRKNDSPKRGRFFSFLSGLFN